MKTKTKNCIDCNTNGTYQRRRCFDCYTKYNRKRVKDNYEHRKKKGIKIKRYGITQCVICKKELIKNRPNQIAHGKCKTRKLIMEYNDVPRTKDGKNTLARRMVLDLGIKLSSNQIVHHIDENPLNNICENFLIMSVSQHGSLHGFLREQWFINKSIYKKSIDKKWRKIVIELNFIWIENKNHILSVAVKNKKLNDNIIYKIIKK